MTYRPDMLVRWTLPASVLAHGALLVALALLAVPRTLQPAPERVIAVDLVKPPPIPPPPPAVPVAGPVLTSPAPAATEGAAATGDADGMVAASDFYAAGILADPANEEVRKNFPLLATSEQVTQLCNMEALEQLRSAEPAVLADALVGYAFDAVAVSGTELDAQGGAVRSGGRWFHFRYHCAVAPDIASVSAFQYALGAPIPKDQWEAHYLNGDDDWLN